MLKNIYNYKYFWRKLFKPNIVNHMGVRIDTSDPHISDWIKDAIYKGFYERAESKILKNEIKNSDIVMEIGGGIGLIANICKQAQTTIVYEANQNLIPIIKKNTILNKNKIKLFNGAVVSDRKLKDINFYEGKDFWNASLEKREGFTKTSVKTYFFLEELKKFKPNFLIIDVEGYEYKLLSKIKLPKFINKILLEVHPKILSKDQILSIINQLINQDFILTSKCRDTILLKK